MKGKLFALALALGTCAGCPATQVRKLDTRLNELYDARRGGRASAATSADLVALAKEARAKAEQAPDPVERVELYRIAAVAAWQAGEPGKSLVGPIAQAGLTACQALPGGESDAPQDCAVIRLTVPLAAADDLARQLIAFQQKQKSLPTKVLPAADLAPIERLFDGFETQLTNVTTIRDRMRRLDVSDEITIPTDTQRLVIYCNAARAWSLTADVDGTSMADFTAMEQRKRTMAAALGRDGMATDCQAVPFMLTSDAGPR